MKKTLFEKRRGHVGRLLQRERKCLHIEQSYLAKKMGVRQEQISKIEVGKRRIDIIELISYCEALNYSLTEVAWKIETYLHAEGLLPPPKTNIKKKKIGVEVSWCENKFSASFREFLPKTVVLTANTLDDLQKEVKKKIETLVDAMTKVGGKVPRWIEKNEYEFEYKFSDATSLLKAYVPNYLSLAAISRTSGINQNLLSQYANGFKNARPDQMKRIMDAIHKIGKELMAAV